MSGSCTYDCSVRGPASLPDSDITGIGVTVNYIVTAGLSILVITIYYLTVYEPSDDPFDKSAKETILSRCNPVDNLILGGVRSVARWLLKNLVGSDRVAHRLIVRIGKILIKCILVMSDLQTVTGLAILVSGYTQLECGLSSLEWRAILDLAWFSYITQLSCLTVLQDHLYTHTFERFWRLLATGALATLLAVGLLLTGNPMWNMPGDSRPAICKLGCYEDYDYAVDISLSAFRTSIISAVFVMVAFISRVVRLHKFLKVRTLGQAIYWLDFQGRQLLWVLFKWFCTGESIYSLKRSLIYRPLFGIFVTLRLLFVSWASFAVEISWVCIGFSWGVYRLYLDLGDQSEFFNASREDWTFGQVVSVIMLMAPLISVIGAFNDEDTEVKGNAVLQTPPDKSMPSSEPSSQVSHLPVTSIEVKSQDDPENPDTDWAMNTTFLGTVTAYCFGACLAIACFIFGLTRNAQIVSPLGGVKQVGLGIPLAFWQVYCLVLCSMIIELAVSRDRPWLRRLLLSMNIGVLLTVWSFFTTNLSLMPYPNESMAVVGVYIISALIHRIFGWTKGLAKG